MIYICKVWNGRAMEEVLVGIYTHSGDAYQAGMDYINEQTDNKVDLLDWERDGNNYTDYFQDHYGNAYTRIISETEVDKRLA